MVENEGAYTGTGLTNLGKKKYEWSEPQLLAELNDGTNIASLPCLSSDGLSIYLARNIPGLGYSCIVEASRPVPEGPFTTERVLTELMTTGLHVQSPWISEDGLRLYYKEAQPAGPELLRMAERAFVTDLWTPAVKTFYELHEDDKGVTEASLTSDELTIFFQSNGRIPSVGLSDIYMATRSSTEEPFTNVTNVTEDLSAMALKGFISQCDYFIGSRMHSNISALSSNVPAIAVSYSHKFLGIMKMFGLDDFVIPFEDLSTEALIDTFEKEVEAGSEIRDKMKKVNGRISRDGSEMKKSLIASIAEGLSL